MRNRTPFSRAAAILCAALLAMTSTPAYAGETEGVPSVTGQVEVPESEAPVLRGETEATGDKSAEEKDSSSEADGAKAVEQEPTDALASTKNTNDEGTKDYIVVLPIMPGVQYADVDESHKSEEYSTDEETILLYTQGEHVSFSVDTSFSWSVYDKAQDSDILKSGDVKNGKVSFTMPADDLIVRYIVPNADGADVVNETEKGSEQSTEAAIPANRETEQGEKAESVSGFVEEETESETVSEENAFSAISAETEKPETEAVSEKASETETETETETEQTTFKVIAPDGDGYSMSVKGGETHEAGEKVTVVVTPKEGQLIDEVTAYYDGNVASADQTNQPEYASLGADTEKAETKSMAETAVEAASQNAVAPEDTSENESADAAELNLSVKNIAVKVDTSDETPDSFTVGDVVGEKKMSFRMPKANVVLRAKATPIPGGEALGVTGGKLYSMDSPEKTLKINYIKDGNILDNMSMDVGGGTSTGNGGKSRGAYYSKSNGNNHINDGARAVEFTLADGSTYTTFAYCLQNDLGNPSDETFKTGKISLLGTNENVAKGLYYLYRGPGWGLTVNGVNVQALVDQWTNQDGKVTGSSRYAVTHAVLCYLNNPAEHNWAKYWYGELDSKTQAAIEKIGNAIKGFPAPSSGLSTSGATASWDGNYYSTGAISFSSTVPGDWAQATIPAHMYLNVGNRRYSGGNVAQVNAGESFTISVDAEFTGTPQTLVFKTRYGTSFVPYKFDAAKKSQDLGFAYVANNGTTLTINWQPGTNVKIRKSSAAPVFTDNNRMYSLNGATFDLEGNGRKYTFTVDANGNSAEQLVLPGNYTLTETVVPTGYKKAAPMPVTVKAGAGSQTFEVKDEPKKASANLTVQKKIVSDGDDTGHDLSTAQFTIKYYDNVDASGDPKNVWVIHPTAVGGSNPQTYVASLDQAHLVSGSLVYGAGRFPLGSISIQETYAPNGTVLNSAVQTFQLLDSTDNPSANIKLESLDVHNNVLKLQIRKLDEAGKDLPGAKLAVFDAGGNKVDEWTADGKPHNISKKLHEGDTYTISEVSVPAGYVKAKPVTFTVKNTPELQTFTMVDKQVLVSKTDVTGDKEIPGAKLTVTDKNGNPVDSWTSTNKSHPVSGLSVGETYTMTETLAPKEFVKANSIKFTVLDDGKVQTVRMVDKQLVVSKTDVTGDREIPGAKLTITDKDGKVVDEWTSTEKPHYTSGLEAGASYTLTETTAPDGFVRAESIKFTVKDDGKIQTVSMKDKQVTLTKLDITGGKEIPGASITVKDKDGRTVDEWVSEEKPHAISGLEDGGTYTLTETTAPEGFSRNPETIEFSVMKDSGDQHLTMKDRQVFVTKTDITNGQEIPGAHLSVTDKDGNVVDEWTSTGNPHPISGIVDGEKYSLTETKPADGFVTAESIQFTVDDELKENQVVEMKDDITKVDISKQEITGGKEIPGAHLVIKDKDGNVVAEWDSTETPHYIERIPIGSYTLTETKPADGYVTAETISFEVKDTPEIQHVKMYDDVTKVEISKQDITTKEELPGAKLVIRDKDGKTVETWVSTDEPHYIEKLPIGDYTLTEITAPNGYQKAETVKFTVKDTGEIQHVVMYDSPIPPQTSTPPKTSDPFNPIILAGAAAAIALLVFGILLIRKKKNKKV